MIRVGVVGAAGKMGEEVCRAINADPGTELVARIDLDDSLEQLTGQRADVVVDFTVLDAARETLHFAAANGIHAVVGTTGFSDEDLESFRAAFTSSNALIAPNFAIGAVLMIRMAELAAPHFETAEIIEFHHNAKVDAPSGTALTWLRSPLPSARGARSSAVERARGGDIRDRSVSLSLIHI